MTTYIDIQEYVKENFGFIPKSCWIAHVKEISGLPVRRAPNRQGEDRMVPCPPGKVKPIQAALIHFGMISRSQILDK
jgi:hypothetical protein